MKKTLLFTLSIGITIFVSPPRLEASPETRRPLHIVLDPGHGGDDEGTVFHGRSMEIAEKDITLSLAYAASKQLRGQGYQVTLTREADHEVPLASRTALANRLKADLFISIHMNSAQNSPKYPKSLTESPPSAPQGVETYILNHASNAASKRLAHLENSVILSGAPGPTEDPNVDLILKDLRLDASFSESKKLACLIQENLALPLSAAGGSQNTNRGVKQALFHVLLGADMPSVLVEAGFLSHPKDRARVLSPQGQIGIGRAIATAVERFFIGRENPKSREDLSKCKIH